jgi:hypothetical protein
MSETISAAQYRQTKPKKSKYGNKRCVVAGRTFDSVKEGNRYLQLMALEAAGEISHLECQPVFKLANGSTPIRYASGRQAFYKADFAYFDFRLNKRVVEDVKGMRTDVYKLKKAMVEAQFPAVKIVEI